MIIDAHLHVWDLTRARYDWLTDVLAPIDRTMIIEDVAPALRDTGVDAAVLVQAADNAEDTANMLRVAAESPKVVGVVGYLPLEHPEEVATLLPEFRGNPLLVGVRNLIHDLPDPDFLLRDDVNVSLAQIADAGLTFDLVSVLPRHLEHAVTLAEKHPDLKIVVDHLSKPPIGEVGDALTGDPWWDLITRAAEQPLVHAKLSGLYPGQNPANWSPETLRPFVDRALEVFGPGRLMYGGDWPISVLAGGYERVWGGLSELLTELSVAEQDQILGGTAAEFYGLDSGRLQAAVTNIWPV